MKKMTKNFIFNFTYFLFIITIIRSVDSLNKAYCKCRSKVSSRIIGGNFARLNSYPWQVSLGILPDTLFKIRPNKYPVTSRESQPEWLKIATHLCGGAILSEYIVLTAAHCVTDSETLVPLPAKKIGVGFGNRHNLIEIYNHGRIQVEKIYVHPKYNVTDNTTFHDIAILKLTRPLSFESESVRPACLLQENKKSGKPKNYRHLISTGWGSVNTLNFNFITRVWEGYKASLKLKEATFNDVSSVSKTCQENPSLICIGSIKNESVCKGDSGGPLHALEEGQKFVVGLTSFGNTKKLGIFSVQACSGTTGYTRIQSSLEWIKSVVYRTLQDQVCLFEQVDDEEPQLI